MPARRSCVLLVAWRKTLAGEPSPEVRRRMEKVLAMVDSPLPPPGLLSFLRAVEVLERIGTAEARQVLEQLAKGAPEARLTREAKVALERLTKRPATSP